MILSIKKGDLFNLDSNKYAFAHCISHDAAMGAGIAKTFDSKFPKMKPYCKRVINENNLWYPCVIPYFDDNVEIYNLVTKNKYWNKPTLESLRATVRELAYMCNRNNTKHLAIPKIGCGLDKLDWKDVRKVLEEEFSELDIEIEVRYI